MEFFALAGIALLIGSLLGWASFIKVNKLESQIQRLTNELNALRKSLSLKSRVQTPPEDQQTMCSPPTPVWNSFVS